MSKSQKVKFEVVMISGIATGVGMKNKFPDGSGFYTEKICETLFDSGNDERDAKDSMEWAIAICEALNKQNKEQ